MSLPNAKGYATSDSADTSSADKRRNKLGYHRTSVACGHCRRRKIRCIIAPIDAQGRCSNCIRLKKECTFYPVDQQLQMEARIPLGAAAEVTTTSETSSPANDIEQEGRRRDGIQCSSSIMPLDQDRSRSNNSNSPDDTVYDSSHPYEYTHSPLTWQSAPWSKNSTAGIFDPGWRIPGESPVTPASAYSPYTPGLQHSTWPSITSEHASRDDVNWTVPNRSMSYGAVEGVSLQSAYPFPQGPVAPGISEAHAPALTSSAISPTTIGGTHSMVPEEVSASGQSTSLMPVWQPYSYEKLPILNAEAYDDWYGPALTEFHQANVEAGGESRDFSRSSSATYYPNNSKAGR